MKSFKFLIVLLFVISGITTEVKAQNFDVSFSTFQRDLGPYGRWYNNPKYGQVWSYNQPGFRPYYSDGHWEYTDYGWEWVSDFDWGWAPFHYGRWEYDPYDGWIWIPGYEWAPAWVSWSSYEGYYGWAPLGYGLNINISFGSIPYDRWTFVPRQNICDRDLNRYYVAPQRNNGFHNAVIINNVYNGRGHDGRFFRGPDRNDVQRYTHNTIQERRVDNREKTGVIDHRGNPRNNNAGIGNRTEQNNNVPQNQQSQSGFDRINRGQQDARNKNFPGRQQHDQQIEQQKQQQIQQQQRQQQTDQPQKQQQTEQQQRLQQMEQQKRQQQADQQQKQQQIQQQQRQQQTEQQRRQQQVDQQQKQQQVQQQQRQQQMEQQKRQQQVDQQQKQQQVQQQQRQQQMEQQRRQQQVDQQQKQQQQVQQQQMEQQRRQQQEQQRQQQMQQQRQQQDNKRQQPTYQGPPIREAPKQNINPPRPNDGRRKGNG